MTKVNDELLTLVDLKDRVVGTVKRSFAKNDKSKIIRIVSISVFNELGETLIQKRSANKSHGGKWENAASGHVAAGENPDDTAKREIFEELGIKSNPIYFDKWLIDGESGKKFMWIYYIIIPKATSITFDKYEVEEVKWIKPKDLKEFSKNNFWDLNGYSHKEIMATFNLIKK